MQRREFVTGSAAMLGAMTIGTMSAPSTTYAEAPIARGVPLKAPKSGKINVAFAIAEGANVIDLAGAWEVFQDVHVGRRIPTRLSQPAGYRSFRSSRLKTLRNPI